MERRYVEVCVLQTSLQETSTTVWSKKQDAKKCTCAFILVKRRQNNPVCVHIYICISQRRKVSVEKNTSRIHLRFLLDPRYIEKVLLRAEKG